MFFVCRLLFVASVGVGIVGGGGVVMVAASSGNSKVSCSNPLGGRVNAIPYELTRVKLSTCEGAYSANMGIAIRMLHCAL